MRHVELWWHDIEHEGDFGNDGETLSSHCVASARNRSGNHSALTAECRSLGYAVSPHCSDGVVCIWKRGLNVAPIRLKSDPRQSDEFKVQRLALLVADRQILLRNVHGPHVPGDDRERFLSSLCADPAEKGSITAGDFNCEPEPYQGTRVMFPVETTFRWNPGRAEWTSKLDGIMVPNILSLNAEVIALDPVVGAQHRPVVLCLNQKFGEHDVVTWCKPPMCPAQPWSEKSKEEFKCAMDKDDVDEAWKTWANAAGVTVPHCKLVGRVERVIAKSGGCVSVSDNFSPEEPRLAENELKVLSDLLSLHAEERLSQWKNSYDQRRSVEVDQGKNGQEDSATPTLPIVDKVLFSPEDAATNLEKDLSMRWNTGVRHFDCEACGNTTNLLRNAKEFTWKKESLPPRKFEVADMRCFQNLPAYTPPEKWTKEAVPANISEGAAGPDGLTSEFLHTLEDDSFDRLIELTRPTVAIFLSSGARQEV